MRNICLRMLDTMMHLRIMVILSLATATIPTNFGDATVLDARRQNDGFILFLEQALERFPEWARDGNQVPTRPIPGPVDISSSNAIVQLDCQISSFYVVGFSLDIRTSGVSSDILNQSFRFESYPRRNVTLAGLYKANGTVLSSIPLVGEGEFRIVVDELVHKVNVTGYKIGFDGFVDISQAEILEMYASLSEVVHINFDGLLDDGAGGYEKVVEEAIISKILDYIGHIEGDLSLGYPFPALDVLYFYLAQVFRDTPLSEIIGTTSPPQTTVTFPSSTESGTCAPCECTTSDMFSVVQTGEEVIGLDGSMVEVLEKYLGRSLLKGQRLVVG